MRRLLIGLLWATMLFVLPASHAQTPANEHNCPATTAIPPYVGSGTKAFSPNQNLCLPQLAPAPTDHIIHSGTVSTGGTFGNANRNLLDFFQVALDPQHRANIAFADDHLASPLCTTQSPGHCANNDPAAFRAATPYFTYQLKSNPNIVTSGKCAGS